MIFYTPPKRYPRPRSRNAFTGAAPVAQLTLVSALYDTGDLMVTLTFDRAIDISTMDATQITLNDAD